MTDLGAVLVQLKEEPAKSDRAICTVECGGGKQIDQKHKRVGDALRRQQTNRGSIAGTMGRSRR
jgi:hypothetical protein